jgi:hypothetical protein
VRGLVFVGTSLLLHNAGAAAADGPRPPCGEAPQPAYAAPGGSPNVQTWSGGDLGPNWRPPHCVSWTSPGFGVLVALASSFADRGTAQDLLARFGRISRLTAIRYWSVTDQAWDPLVTSATALRGADSGQRRPDFAPAEMTEGSTLFFAQSDNRSSGDVVYRLLIRELRPDRLVIATENVTPVHKLFLTMFAPGELQSTYFLERRSPGVWTYYSLSRTSPDANPLAGGHAASYLNRAVALFRYVAGIPTDQEPPPPVRAELEHRAPSNGLKRESPLHKVRSAAPDRGNGQRGGNPLRRALPPWRAGSFRSNGSLPLRLPRTGDLKRSASGMTVAPDAVESTRRRAPAGGRGGVYA